MEKAEVLETESASTDAARKEPIGRYQTVAQVARLFGKSAPHINNQIRAGKITHCEPFGATHLIDVYSEWPNLFAPEIAAEKQAGTWAKVFSTNALINNK